MEHWVDDLARTLAGGMSRRTLLRRLGVGLAVGPFTALLPTAAWAQRTDACRDFCQDLSGDARRRCQSDAARGGGICQACEADPERLCRPTDKQSPLYDQTLCCAENQTCQSSGCQSSSAATPTDTRVSIVTNANADDCVAELGEGSYLGVGSSGNGGVATASTNGGVNICDPNSADQGGPILDLGPVVSPAASAGAFNQLPSFSVPTMLDCPKGTTACGLAGCCPSGTTCSERGCVRAA